MRRAIAGLAVAATMATGAGGQAGAASFDATLTGTGVDRSTEFPVAGDQMVILSLALYESLTSADPANPFNGAHGPCFGRIDVAAGKARGDGYCTFDARDGKVVIRWTADETTPDGVTRGGWQVYAGSGEWVGATGGGRFVQTIDLKTGHLVNNVTGKVTLK